jgi:hypothetical protein
MQAGDAGAGPAAVMAFLGAGLDGTLPRATAVEAYGRALRMVALHQERGLPVDQWLAGEVGLRGVRENAAVLAVLQRLPERRARVAEAYRRAHPDRSELLMDLLAIVAAGPAGAADLAL